MSDGDRPLVSIGLPVFNGETYLAKAIESVLGQTLRNLELIICDNASTDRTQAICEGYARRDARVRYVRNARNLGAGPNYDLAFHRARGTFFKWLAHDDGMAPAWLERAVACLDRHPGAVLCHVGIVEIGPDDEVLRMYANDLPGVDSPRPSVRFAGMILHRHQCEPFFGVFRRAALVGSSLHGMFRGADRVLLAEMALRGPCVAVPEPLFLHRDHAGRYTRAVLPGDSEKVERWWDTSHPASRFRSSLHFFVRYGQYWRIARKTVGGRRERWACYGHLVRWWFTGYHFREAATNLLAAIHPRLLAGALKVKRALFGIRPRLPGGRPIPTDGPEESDPAPVRVYAGHGRGAPPEPMSPAAPARSGGSPA